MRKQVMVWMGVLALAGPALADGNARLQAFEAWHKELGAAAATYTATFEIPASGVKNDARMQLRLQRPNRLRLMVTEEKNDSALVSDGNLVYTAIGATRRYTLNPAPASFAEWAAKNAKKRRPIPLVGADILLQLLGAQTVIPNSDALEHDGQESIAGQACDRFHRQRRQPHDDDLDRQRNAVAVAVSQRGRQLASDADV